MTKDEIIEFLKVEFPQSLEKCEIVSITPRGALVNYHIDERDLRPGGTVSGPTMMTGTDGSAGRPARASTPNIRTEAMTMARIPTPDTGLLDEPIRPAM